MIETSSCPGYFWRVEAFWRGRGCSSWGCSTGGFHQNFTAQPQGQALCSCCGQVLQRSQLESSRENIAVGWDGDCPGQDLQIKQQLLLVRLTQTRNGYLGERDVSKEAKLTEVMTSHVGSPFPTSSPHLDWTCRTQKHSGSCPDQHGESRAH